MKLLRWLVERNISTISLRDIQVHGSGALRDAESVKEAAGMLEKHGLATIKVVHTGRRPSQKLYMSPLADSVL